MIDKAIAESGADELSEIKSVRLDQYTLDLVKYFIGGNIVCHPDYMNLESDSEKARKVIDEEAKRFFDLDPKHKIGEQKITIIKMHTS